MKDARIRHSRQPPMNRILHLNCDGCMIHPPLNLLIRNSILLMLLLFIPLSESFVLPSPPCPRSIASTRQPSPTQLFGIKGFRGWFESQFPDAITAIPKRESQESFDHVLIDINQLLHVALRRSSSDDHALALTMRELNTCVELATPRKSLVLAMDGSPSAAKLATSRKRRLSTLLKTDWKETQLARFQKSKKLFISPVKEKRLRRRYASEVRTLRITPGTDFMERANQALLYWAWQRMISQDGPLAGVSIFLSTSDVPGEGEVKLLDWILRKRPQGTLAIMGGDSDLVLEGLVIPPSICTHNVFVLLPDLGQRYLVVSLWETTRHLQRLLPELNAKDIMFVRSDMVLLLILNGNDYLPKLRGSSGFNRVFRTYIQLVQDWLQEGKGKPFLIDPDSLEFHREFAVELFQRLKLDRPLDNAASIADQQVTVITPLGQLNNLVSTQFMPKPMTWSLVAESPNSDSRGPGLSSDNDESRPPSGVENDADDEDDEGLVEEEEKDDEDFDDDDDLLDFDGDRDNVMLRLSLGVEGSKDYYSYEIRHNPDDKLKDTKDLLAKLALEDLMGPEFLDTSVSEIPVTNSLYPWEIRYAVDSDCELYIGGLLWNLQTYQDGICSDYGYNYGKRLSPTAEDLVDYFQKALDENRKVGKQELLVSGFTPPVKNGVSCLAALPSQLNELISKPYSEIPREKVEELYGECVSPIDNGFDIKSFSDLCENEIKAKKVAPKRKPKKDADGLKRVGLGKDYWTVVFRGNKPVNPAFKPPPPIIKAFTPLYVNRRVKAARFSASTRPRERSIWKGKGAPPVPDEIAHSDISRLLKSKRDGGCSIFDVNYWMPYSRYWKKKPSSWMPSIKNSNVTGVNGKSHPESAPETKKKKNKRISDQEVADRIATFNMEMDFETHPKKASISGQTPLAYLISLEQVDMIDFEWKSTIPSPTEFASISPEEFECIELVVRRGDAPLNSTFKGELTFKRDREITRGSKQDARQYLASMALTRLLAHKNVKWHELRFPEMKSLLIPDYEFVLSPKLSSVDIGKRLKKFGLEHITGIQRSISLQTSIAYMSQLQQDKLLKFEFTMAHPSTSDFASVSPQDFECVRLVVTPGQKELSNPFVGELVFERDRLVGRDMKLVKQHLCSVALNRLLDDQGRDWRELPYKELKSCLKTSTKIKTNP